MSSILGALFAILIGIIAIIPYLNYENQSLETIRAANTASQFKQLINATRLYVEDNYSTLNGTVTATSSNPPNCQINQPCLIPFSNLQLNYLSSTLSNVTPYNQTWQIEVLLPETNDPGMKVLIFTYGGFNIPAPKLAMIAAETGQEAGFIIYPGQDNTSTQVNLPEACDPTATIKKGYSNYQAEAMGAYGHWSLSLPMFPLSQSTKPNKSPQIQFCPGHLAALLYFGPNGTLEDDYLYRVAVPGESNLNTMQTNLLLNSQNAGGSIGVQTASQNEANTTNTESSNTSSSSTISALSNSGNVDNQVVTTTNSSQSSTTISAATSLGNDQIAMTATDNQSSASISAAAAGGSNQIALSATNSQASLAVEGTSRSANYLTITSTQESPGTSCLSNQIGNIAPDSDNSGTPLACVTATPYGAASWQKMIGFTSTNSTPPPQSGQTYASGVTNNSGGTEFVSVTCPQTPQSPQVPQIEISVSSNNYLPPTTIYGSGFVSAMIPANYEFQIMTNPPYSLYQCSVLTTH